MAQIHSMQDYIREEGNFEDDAIEFQKNYLQNQ